MAAKKRGRPAKKVTVKKREKELEVKLEKLVEKKVKDYFEKHDREKAKSKITSKSEPIKLFGELIGYIFVIIFLFLIIPKLPFITSGYNYFLPIAFWTTSIATLFKIIKHASSLYAVKRIFEIGDNLTSLYSTKWLLLIYPFDFSKIGIGQFNIYFRYILYVVIFAILISILVNFIRIFFPQEK